MDSQTSSMWAPKFGFRGIEMVDIVLHEGRSPAQASSHHLHSTEGPQSSVAFRTEAVPILHRSLHGQTRQLLKTNKILEIGGKSLEPTFS